MSSSRRSSQRLSDIWQRAKEPFVEWRKSLSRRSSVTRPSQSSSSNLSTPAESTPPTSFSATEDWEDRLITPSVDHHGTESQHQTAPEPPKASQAANLSCLWTSARRSPPVTPPISPRSTSPQIWERGRLTLPSAINDTAIMALQVQSTRKAFKTNISKFFTFTFADAKTLLKALDKLSSALKVLHSSLPPPSLSGKDADVISRSTLNEIELLDMHLGPLLQESDRVLRAMTRGSSRTGPLTGRTKSMRKSMIKDDLGPQMVEMAESLGILEGRVKSSSQVVRGEIDSAVQRV